MRFLFVDSNLLLQCHPLGDLDWERLVGTEEVTILVPSAVLEELDKHKAGGNSRRAQRARRAVKFLNSILEAPDDAVIVRETPAKVIAQFAPEIPRDSNISNDDSILFEVAELSRLHGSHAVALVTHDTNLKVKAKRKGLTFFPVPDEWLLPPEPDERDKRVRHLEEEVALLKRQAPVFEIMLDGIQEIELNLPIYEPLTPDQVRRMVESMTAKFPLKTDFSLPSVERGSLSLQHPPEAWEIAEYQHSEYPKWVDNLRGRLEQLDASLRVRYATSDIRLLIGNTGTVPGEHVHIAVRVSEGFLIFDQERHEKLISGLFMRPRAPNPPQPRHSSLDVFGGVHKFGEFTSVNLPEIPARQRRDEFYLKTGADVDSEWVWECENMRHGAQREEFGFMVGVHAQSLPSGGHLTIEVSAENLPKAVVKQIPIRVTNLPGDTERAAKEWLGLSSG